MTEKFTETLEPCPFCGSPAEMVTDAPEFFPICTKRCSYTHSIRYVAAEKWNKRAPMQQLKTRCEELEAAEQEYIKMLINAPAKYEQLEQLLAELKDKNRMYEANVALLQEVGVLRECIYDLVNNEDAALDQAYELISSWEQPPQPSEEGEED